MLVPNPGEGSKVAHCGKLGASGSGRFERVVSEMRYLVLALVAVTLLRMAVGTNPRQK